MFGSMPQGANAYANIGVETGVLAASPHKLITMLLDGAMVAIAMGLKHMKAGDIKNKGEAITKAILIIESGLRASLNKNVGGEMTENLDALYEYMARRLFAGNVENSTAALEEVHALLEEIRESWEAIGPEVAKMAQQQQAQAQAAA